MRTTAIRTHDWGNQSQDQRHQHARRKRGSPLQEPAATKRQASDDAPVQAPPSPFLIPVEQETNGEQRPDPAQKARPPSPPGELRARTKKERLNPSAHERLRLPKDGDMEVIHYSAIPFHWQLPKIFPCPEISCKPSLLSPPDTSDT